MSISIIASEPRKGKGLFLGVGPDIPVWLAFFFGQTEMSGPTEEMNACMVFDA